jgi:hypothetical protein
MVSGWTLVDRDLRRVHAFGHVIGDVLGPLAQDVGGQLALGGAGEGLATFEVVGHRADQIALGVGGCEAAGQAAPIVKPRQRRTLQPRLCELFPLLTRRQNDSIATGFGNKSVSACANARAFAEEMNVSSHTLFMRPFAARPDSLGYDLRQLEKQRRHSNSLSFQCLAGAQPWTPTSGAMLS